MEEIEVKKIIAELLHNGETLNSIQETLKNEHSVSMTFLDLRLLAADLENIDWGANDETPADEEEDAEESDVPVDAVPVGTGETVVELNKLVRPGAIANGSVQFASGASSDWLLTQMGQIALENTVGEPTEEDFEEFKTKLQQSLQSMGF